MVQFRNGYKIVEKPAAVRRGVAVAKQVKVLVQKGRKERHMRDVQTFEDFLDDRVEEAKPRNRPGKRLQYMVTVRYKVDDFVVNMNTDWLSMADAVEMSDFTERQITLDGYNHEQFNFGNRSPKALDRAIFVSYRYIDDAGGKDDDDGENPPSMDCLLDCISKIAKVDSAKFHEISPVGQMTPVDRLFELEGLLEINIDVPNVYMSERDYDVTVPVLLFDNHFSLMVRSDFDRKLICNDTKTFENCPIVILEDGISTRMTKEGLSTKKVDEIEGNWSEKQLREMHRFKKIWIPFCSNQLGSKSAEDKWYLFDEFERFVRTQFDTSFTRYNTLADFAVALWLSTMESGREISCANLIDDNMLDLIMTAGSALVHNPERGVMYNDCTVYDFNSFYPSLMMSGIPLDPPRYGGKSSAYTRRCTEEEREKYGLEFFCNLYPQGWYHVDISDEELFKEQPKRFAKSKSGYYSRDEIMEMSKHRYKFKLTERRAIIWPMKTKREAPFNKFINTLFDFKKRTGNKVAKLTMNCLLGKLASKNYQLMTPKNSKPVQLKRFEQVEQGVRNGFMVKSAKQSKYKYLPWIQALVYSRARMRLNKLIDEVGRENVIAVHTDGITVKGAHKRPELGDGLGELKIEKSEMSLLIEKQSGKKIWTKGE
jgi:hypothetical protein